MKKAIYHSTINYDWRVIRYSKGVKKPAKTWKKSTYTTCTTGRTPEDLYKINHLMKNLELRCKSTNEVEIKITSIVEHDFVCMSHDVY